MANEPQTGQCIAQRPANPCQSPSRPALTVSAERSRARLGRKPSYDRAAFDRIRLALDNAAPPSLSVMAKAEGLSKQTVLVEGRIAAYGLTLGRCHRGPRRAALWSRIALVAPSWRMSRQNVPPLAVKATLLVAPADVESPRHHARTNSWICANSSNGPAISRRDGVAHKRSIYCSPAPRIGQRVGG
jgi:hypothetical protein